MKIQVYAIKFMHPFIYAFANSSAIVFHDKKLTQMKNIRIFTKRFTIMITDKHNVQFNKY